MTNLAIQAGDSIGIDATESASMGNGATVGYVLGGTATYSEFGPALSDGGIIGPAKQGSAQLDLNADVVLDTPAVDALSPPVGSGGQTVTISGRHLANVSSVSFGGVPAGIVSNSNTQVVAVAPAVPAGTVDVTVTALGGTSPPSSTARYTYPAADGGGVLPGTAAGGSPSGGAVGVPGAAAPPTPVVAGKGLKETITAVLPSGLSAFEARHKGIAVLIGSSRPALASVALFQGRDKKPKIRKSLRLRAPGPTKVVLKSAKLIGGAYRVAITVQGRSFNKRGTLAR